MACSFLTMVRPHYPHIIHNWCEYHAHKCIQMCLLSLSLFQTLCCITHLSSSLWFAVFPGVLRWRVFCGLWMCFHFVLYIRRLSVHPWLALDPDIGSLWTEAEVQILIFTWHKHLQMWVLCCTQQWAFPDIYLALLVVSSPWRIYSN